MGEWFVSKASASVKAFLKHRKLLRTVVYTLFGWSLALGIDLRRILPALKGLPGVSREYLALRLQNRRQTRQWKVKFSTPCFQDRYDTSGTASGHYFHQDLLVARRVFARKPAKHVDVGSRIDGFVAHVATFRPIEVLDIRPQPGTMPNTIFKQCDLMNVPENMTEYCDSLSCLHALEHFGLGRYGDPIDVNGHLRGFDSLHKIVQSGGILYLSVPIGEERVEFNGHRVFALKSVLEWSKDRFELVGFSYVDDEGDLHEDVTLQPRDIATSLDLFFGCGIFEFRKR
jgi:hypothetical protein